MFVYKSTPCTFWTYMTNNMMHPLNNIHIKSGILDKAMNEKPIYLPNENKHDCQFFR